MKHNRIKVYVGAASVCPPHTVCTCRGKTKVFGCIVFSLLSNSTCFTHVKEGLSNLKLFKFGWESISLAPSLGDEQLWTLFFNITFLGWKNDPWNVTVFTIHVGPTPVWPPHTVHTSRGKTIHTSEMIAVFLFSLLYLSTLVFISALSFPSFLPFSLFFLRTSASSRA